jgi:dUTP pyrophosphatase
LQRVGEFEKVSYELYRAAMLELISTEYGEELIEQSYNDLQLPSRATSGSAGYDFKAPIAFTLNPGFSIKLPTGIRVKIDDGWWLGCLPRSGHGVKFRLQLDNTMGVIDSDYYYSDNEGHIFAKITNDGRERKTIYLQAGEGFMQAIFIPYGITHSDDAKGIRNGGWGSTG